VVAAWKAAGASVLWVLVDHRVAGVCQLSDRMRSDTKTAVAALRSIGIQVMMLTGDCEAQAQHIRAAAGIDTAHSAMKPKDKLDKIIEIRKSAVVGMVGDGVNDGPALAAADVGVAMGVAGTAMASEAAGVVLMTNDLRKIPDAIIGARRCTHVMYRSVLVALALKLVPLLVMFVTDGHGYLTATAVGSDVLGIFFVLTQALSLLTIKPRYAASGCSSDADDMSLGQVASEAAGRVTDPTSSSTRQK